MRAIASVMAAAEASFDARTIEPTLLELREFLELSVDRRRESVEELLAMTVPGPEGAELSRPGVVEILEFCMRELRWPEIQEAMIALDSPARDWRARRAAQRVLEVYDEDWPGGEIYDTYGED